MKYNFNRRFEIQDQINTEIIEIDQKISENSKALIEAQIVKFRSAFSRSDNFLEKIGRNVYQTKLDDSIKWHQKELKNLYFRRRELQMNLEKIKGIYWLNQIKRLVKIIFIVFFIVLSLFIFLSGFMVIIYLLPIIILIFTIYLLMNKKY